MGNIIDFTFNNGHVEIVHDDITLELKTVEVSDLAPPGSISLTIRDSVLQTSWSATIDQNGTTDIDPGFFFIIDPLDPGTVDTGNIGVDINQT
jgi:hypothetical protein